MATGNEREARPSRQATTSGAGGDTAAVTVPLTGGEPILRQAEREISILVAREDVTITYARYAAGLQVAGPHVHHDHTDAFYILEGELAFEVGGEAETVRVGAGGLVAAPPGLAHSFRTAGNRPARWLTIHAHDGGFAAFMRGNRDGRRVEWDIAPVPADGGLPSSEATVSPGEHVGPGGEPSRLRCALPDLDVFEWRLHGRDQDLPISRRDRHGVTFLVLEGEMEATLARARHTLGPGTLVSSPPGVRLALDPAGAGSARLLTLYTPDNGVADRLRPVAG